MKRLTVASLLLILAACQGGGSTPGRGGNGGATGGDTGAIGGTAAGGGSPGVGGSGAAPGGGAPGFGGGGAGNFVTTTGGSAGGANGGVGGSPTSGAGGGAGAGGRPYDFSAVDARFTARAAAAGMTTLGLTIWDTSDHKVFEHVLGGFTSDTRVAVASASKLVSGLVLFDVIRRGLLTLDSTTGQVLGWTTNDTITLRHLLSFTSGLPPDATCTVNPLITLAACAATLQTANPVAAPGTRFDYGSTHLLVAAAMAEQVTGQPWATLFAQTLQTPLALPGDVAYFTAPRAMVGKINPLIAGGLRASVNEYGDFLALAFHQGSFGGLTVGTPALFDAQRKTPYPDAVIGNSPLPFRYGLASWLECATPTTGCPLLASPGAFGFTPWYDRAAGYYAILGMELDDTGSEVVSFAVSLQAELQPLIAAALAGG